MQDAQSSWSFDIRLLQDATNGQALSTLGLGLFRDRGLVDSLGLHPGKLANFLAQMERGYNKNPYHNSLHTALVLQVSRSLYASKSQQDLCVQSRCIPNVETMVMTLAEGLQPCLTSMPRLSRLGIHLVP